jgi:aerobic-type carbon monoxide dehydrogenase small subunit (CoxS/CutS family)
MRLRVRYCGGWYCSQSCITAEGRSWSDTSPLEGLGSTGCVTPIQQAFIDEQTAQVAIALSSMVMMTAALLARKPRPTDDEIRRELSNLLAAARVPILKSLKPYTVLRS